MYENHKMVEVRWFPFLIGTVRTKYINIKRYKDIKFPFLIGTVRTSFTQSELSVLKYVSIPHRYGKN